MNNMKKFMWVLYLVVALVVVWFGYKWWVSYSQPVQQEPVVSGEAVSDSLVEELPADESGVAEVEQ